jgi:intracellular multiplication protein IcmK
MRCLLVGIVIGAAICVKALGAHAQDLDRPRDKFEDFQQKIEAAKSRTGAGGPADPAAPMAEGEIAPPSPLGVGGELPIDGAPAGMGGMGGAPQTPEELQAMMEQEAAEQQKKLEEATFEMALKQLLPLKPEQIRATLGRFRESREAAETPITVPEARQEVQTASLDPTSEPVVIRMSPNHVTTVTILDATGAPWPIQDMNWAGPFSIVAPESGGNVVRITPQSAHGGGNISIRLVDLITPITMRLSTGVDWVHYRLDVRIPKPGPLAKTPLIEYGGLKSVAGRDEQMVGVLDGTPPPGAERLKVEGVDPRTSAWLMAGHVYLRTPLTLLSPGWDASVSSADGMNVYTLNNAPVVLLSDEGRMVKAHIAPEEVVP